MTPEAPRPTQLRPLQRKAWTLVFRVSGLLLICCLAAIVGFPVTVGYSWVYWVALGSALVCGVAAAVLRKLDGEEASGDAAWLLGFRGREERGRWNLDGDD